MKKLSLAFFVATAFSLSAQAAVLNPANGITTADCTVLGDDVKPTLSTNVKVAYSCNADKNLINVAACHQFGTRKIETEDCAPTGTDANTGDITYNNASCNGTPGQTFKTGNFGKGYKGSTSGGQVAASSLAAACDESGSALEALVQ